MKQKFCLLLAFFAVQKIAIAQQTPETIIINPQTTLKVKDSVLRNQVIVWSKLQLTDSNYKHTKAHPSAIYFPGKTGIDTKLVTNTIHIKHFQISDQLKPVVSKLDYAEPWNKNLYSTGLYAVVGEYIEVTTPKELLGKEVEIQIGIHSDNLGEWVAATEAWRRMPMVVKRTTLRTKTNRINSPFGGLIYLVADPKSASWETDIKISRAIQSPLFEAGKTTLLDWQMQLKNNRAPWANL